MSLAPGLAQRVVLATLALFGMALAGCTAGTDDAATGLDGLGSDEGPTLYLNVTANGETHRFSTADAQGHGHAPGGNATATSSSGTVTAASNATAGNGTAQGNATASNSTATGGAGTGKGNGAAGLPSGDAPLNVTVELGASGLPDAAKSPIVWTLRWGDAASASVSNDTAQAGANGTAAKQKAEETGSTLPARSSHTYAAAGRPDLSFAVAVAGKALDTLHTVVAVGEGAPVIAPGTELGSLPFNATGDVPMGSLVTGCDGEGGEKVPWTFLDRFNGTPAEVSRLDLSLDSSGTVYDVDLFLYAPNGTEIGSATGSGADKTLELTGPFAPGEYVVSIVGCMSAGGEFVLDGAATYAATSRPTT